MKKREIIVLVISALILAIVNSYLFIIKPNPIMILTSSLISVLIIAVNVYSKKIIAHSLDSDVEHDIWSWSRFGFKPGDHFKKEVPAGIIFPLLFSLLSIGILKIPSILTYETRALTSRVSKRFGIYSFAAMTEFHNALIGAAGIISILILSIILYIFPPLSSEYFAKITVFYAFINLLPISKLDGTQIFFGSKILWITLFIITLIFTGYAIVL